MSQTSPLQVDDIRTVAVLGAGTMGHGIAQVAAQSGWAVVLRDVDDARVTAGRDKIAANLAKGVELGKVSAADRDAVLARIQVTTSVAEAARAADVIIEAVPEQLELKQALFREASAAAPARALLASNTSSLSVARIAEAVDRPEQVVGMHFFNPVHLMKLVEVVRHERSAPAAVACALAMAERMGKTAITVSDAP
ncbi:MAG TPA: 3-hydroxyacyl-CoA dehydrogenase NAD-binding domain-containing protein, partial [Kofleriaceae bacterium]|nr:3-hydroxyacyl-CoA dehydrogenase NAD-binding domain-containing protein [Kofleriaceae bacterium]